MIKSIAPCHFVMLPPFAVKSSACTFRATRRAAFPGFLARLDLHARVLRCYSFVLRRTGTFGFTPGHTGESPEVLHRATRFFPRRGHCSSKTPGQKTGLAKRPTKVAKIKGLPARPNWVIVAGLLDTASGCGGSARFGCGGKEVRHIGLFRHRLDKGLNTVS